MPVSIRDAAGRRQKKKCPDFTPCLPSHLAGASPTEAGGTGASTQVGLVGSEQGGKGQGVSGRGQGGYLAPQHSHNQDFGGYLASAASPLQSHRADAPGLGSATGPPDSVHVQDPMYAHSAVTPSGSSLILLQASFLIHPPGPCPASVICKHLKMAYFRQGRLLGIAVLRDESQLMPTAARAAHSGALARPLTLPASPAHGGLAAAKRKDCYL